MVWLPDPTAHPKTGAIVSAGHVFCIYEIRPGEWRATVTHMGIQTRCICRGAPMNVAKARCEEFLRTGK